MIVGRTFDWSLGHGLMMINKRGMAKTGLALPPNTPAKWVSKYGSLTFNQVGREFPYGGMNENGLMIEILWLDTTQFPAAGAKPSTNESQWIQYQLDTSGSTAELIQNLNKVQIATAFAEVHYFVCDASRQCATIEGIGGNFVVHTGATLPIAALTNDSYDSSVNYANPFIQNNQCATMPWKNDSLSRFTIAACAVAKQSTGLTAVQEIAAAENVLNQVAQPGYTQWYIVYDLTAKSIQLHTQAAQNQKTVRLSAFDLGCAKPVEIFDMNASDQGDVTGKFTPYTFAANQKIVDASLAGGFENLPPALVSEVEHYPDSTVCQP
jgi:choloylglycine hydrolase